MTSQYDDDDDDTHTHLVGVLLVRLLHARVQRVDLVDAQRALLLGGRQALPLERHLLVNRRQLVAQARQRRLL